MVIEIKVKLTLLSQCPKLSREFEIDEGLIDEIMLQSKIRAKLFASLVISL